MSPKSNSQMASPQEAAFVVPTYLPPPKDAIELGERIGVFWMVSSNSLFYISVRLARLISVPDVSFGPCDEFGLRVTTE